MLITLSSCATKYNSTSSGKESVYEIIIAPEDVVLQAVYESIRIQFPDTIITPIAGKHKGYSFFSQPLLDRTTYKFAIIKTIGGTAQSKDVSGYTFSIDSYGTQFFVNSRYIDPLISEFKRVLVEKGVTFVKVGAVKFVD